MAKPTATTDDDGAFVLDGVPLGSYVLTYGLADEVATNADQWDGVPVNTKLKHMDPGLGQVEDVLEGSFWQDGRISLGDITAVTAAGNLFLLSDGSVRSDHFGIWITAEDGELVPRVQVQAGQTTDLNWLVHGR